MLSFILHQISSFRAKSISIIGVIALFTLLLAIFLFISKNTFSALEFYSPQSIDPNRVTFTSDTSIFDILSRKGGGIKSEVITKIQSDEIFSRTRLFTFIDTNIVGGFDIFTFHLDTDIPVFGLQDSAGDIPGFGISPSMIHYYNLELAGSHPMFPTLDSSFLRGKAVSLTFGTSKIFQVGTQPSSPLRGSIVSIDADYPGFGIVAPLSQVEGKLREIGNIPRQPYKVIAYMKNPNSRGEIEKIYSQYNPVFDKDLIDKRESQFLAIRLSIFGVGLFFSIIVYALLCILFLGFFREKSSIFRLLRVYGVGFPYRQLILYGETCIFFLFGSILSLITILSAQYIFISKIGGFFRAHGILFPVLQLSAQDITHVLAISTIAITSIIYLTSRRS